jgi:hypothetical protein
MIETIRKHPKLWMVTLYLFLVSGLLLLKPRLAFDEDGHIRPFGTEKKGNTVFPLWLWVIGLAIASYLAVFHLSQRE